MRASGFTGVLDRTPELLGSSGNLSPIGNYTIAVAAVDTIQLFDCVQVAQKMAVYRKVVGAFHQGYTVHPKTEVLIQREAQVQ